MGDSQDEGNPTLPPGRYCSTRAGRSEEGLMRVWVEKAKEANAVG